MSDTDAGSMFGYYAALKRMVDAEIEKAKHAEGSVMGPRHLVAYGERVALERIAQKMAEIARQQLVAK